MAEEERTEWSGQGVLDRIRFAAEMEMYHGSGAVQMMSKDFSPHLTAQDVREMKEREDKAKHIAACSFLHVMEMKKRKRSDAMVIPVVVTSPSVGSSTATVSTDVTTTIASDISTISTPVSSNRSTTCSPKSYGSTTVPVLVALSSDTSLSDDPDEAIV
jgi:hypothetical protein